MNTQTDDKKEEVTQKTAAVQEETVKADNVDKSASDKSVSDKKEVMDAK